MSKIPLALECKPWKGLIILDIRCHIILFLSEEAIKFQGRLLCRHHSLTTKPHKTMYVNLLITNCICLYVSRTSFRLTHML